MPIRQSRVRDRGEVFDERIAEATPEVREEATRDLDGIFHMRVIVKKTQQTHDRLKKIWTEFVDKTKPANAPHELVPGVASPSLGILKSFARFYAMSMIGRLAEYASLHAFKKTMATFIGLWRRYTGSIVSREDRAQFFTYVSSPELRTVAPLTTKMREKGYVNIEDVERILRFIWTDRTLFRTNRMRKQMALLVIFLFMTGERPGAIVESSSYRNTNESLWWSHIAFQVFPNPNDPSSPILAVMPTIHFLKAQRTNESKFKQFFLLIELLSLRHLCATTLLLHLALEDEIFEDVFTVEQILHPETPPEHPIPLKIKHSKTSLPVSRREVFDQDMGAYVISPKDSLKHDFMNKLFHQISLKMGLPKPLSAYGFRRGANLNWGELTEAQLQELMGHAKGSETHRESYLSKKHHRDLVGLARRQGQDLSRVEFLRSSTGMTTFAHPDAPKQLSAAQQASLFDEPELVEIRRKKDEVRKELSQSKFEAATASEDNAEHSSRIAQLEEQIKRLTLKHTLLLNRATADTLQSSRSEFFLNVSTHELNRNKANSESSSRPPLAPILGSVPPSPSKTPRTRGKENAVVASSTATTKRASSQARDLHPFAVTEDVQALLADFFFPSSPRQPVLSEEAIPDKPQVSQRLLSDDVITACSLLSGLPPHPPPPCYPSEAPTADNRCPVCRKQLTSDVLQKHSDSVGSHIHRCIRRALVQASTASLVASYTPKTCLGKKCQHSGPYATLLDYAKHVHSHYKFDKTGSAICRWTNDGEMCGEEVDGGKVDVEEHLLEAHDVDIRTCCPVYYDVIGAEWIVDDTGDKEEWRSTCKDIYDDRFAEFSERPGMAIDVKEIGITDLPSENAVAYDNGTGFDGEHPEFHGDVGKEVATHPMFCPSCVYDDSLHWEVRMKQFEKVQEWVQHVQYHGKTLYSEGGLCPVPACGKQLYDNHGLVTHLIRVHRVPVCGTSRQSRGDTRILNLPSPAEKDNLPTASQVTATSRSPSPSPLPSAKSRGKRRRVLDSDEEEVEVVTSKRPSRPASSSAMITDHAASGPSNATSSTGTAASSSTSSTRVAAEPGWCLACSRSFNDIYAHMSKGTADSNCAKKGYTHVNANWKRDKNSQVYIYPGPYDPVNTRVNGIIAGKRPQNHKCMRCRRTFVDIRNHRCPTTSQPPVTFRSKQDGWTKDKWGPTITYADYCRTAPMPIPRENVSS